MNKEDFNKFLDKGLIDRAEYNYLKENCNVESIQVPPEVGFLDFFL